MWSEVWKKYSSDAEPVLETWGTAETPSGKMGKKNSKLKQDTIERLIAETYCKCMF
jgi:hypothetical protein